jgi:putative ABC transport system permease protein
MNLKTTEMVVGWATPVAAYVVGVGVTFVAAYLPARRAAGVSPMAALADAEIAGVGRPLRVRAVVGLIVGALGAAALVGCVTATRPGPSASLLGLGVVLTLIATVIAGPLLVRPVIRVLGGFFPAVFGSVGRMSQRNALRNPRRTGATAAALMVGLALVGGMSVASASMSKSFDEQIDKTLGADFVVQNATSCRSRRRSPRRCRTPRASDSSYGSGSRRSRSGCRTASGSRRPRPATSRSSTRSPASRTPQGDTAAALADGNIAMDATSPRTTTYASAARSPSSSRPAEPELKVGALTDQDAAERLRHAGRAVLRDRRRSRSTCPAARTPRCT